VFATETSPGIDAPSYGSLDLLDCSIAIAESAFFFLTLSLRSLIFMILPSALLFLFVYPCQSIWNTPQHGALCQARERQGGQMGRLQAAEKVPSVGYSPHARRVCIDDAGQAGRVHRVGGRRRAGRQGGVNKSTKS
jgi:hypothetical protein